ncbi:importin subunit alpha-4 [Gossypium australe]|uniref:Importin subunit alpha-4 n=1 Tax=Gossypium australe TaxID=47621 RepID=A0A5B6VHR1_9ROSI|nr:importin subunit alpha-4 [Gossypium australe]
MLTTLGCNPFLSTFLAWISCTLSISATANSFHFYHRVFISVYFVGYSCSNILTTGADQNSIMPVIHRRQFLYLLFGLWEILSLVMTIRLSFNNSRYIFQFVIDNKVLPHLYQLLVQNHKKSIKKEACWTISNITAGNRAQIQAVIEANIILPLVHLLQLAEFDIKKEAAWAISNATSGGSHEQIQYVLCLFCLHLSFSSLDLHHGAHMYSDYQWVQELFLVSQGCIKPLCDLLICPDPRIVTVCLEGLENILKVGEADKEMGMNGGINLYAQMIDECDGLDKIENLQTHDNHEIYEKAVKILERYWAEEEEDEQNIQDGGNENQQGFNFGVNQQPSVPPGGFKFG